MFGSARGVHLLDASACRSVASVQHQNQRWRWTVFWVQQAEKRRCGRASCGHSVVASPARVICALLLPCLSRYDADIKHDGDKDEVSRGDSGKESHKDEDDYGQICFIGERAVSAPFSLR